MNRKMIVPLIVLAMIIGAGSSMALSPGTTNTAGQVGNFVFQYNASSSVVSNLQYTHEGTTYNLTSQVKATAGSGSNLNLKGPDGSVVMQNATVMNTEAENMFILLTSEMSSNVSVLLNSNLTPTKIDLSSQMSSVSNFMSDHMNMSFGTSVNVYKTDVNGVVFYMFSNVKGTEANGYAYFASGTYPVLLGIVPLAALLNDMHSGSSVSNSFTYNNATGKLAGTYLSLNLNESTGNVTGFTSVMSGNTLFSNINVSAQGTIGDGEDSVLLPAYQPVMLGSLFVYSGSSYIYAFHDNPSLQSIVVWKNGTANFTLANGLTAQLISTQGQDSSVSSQSSTNVSAFSNSTLEADHNVEAGRTAVLINGTGSSSLLLVNNGQVTLSGNSILIHANETGKVTFVSPPGLAGQHLSASSKIYRALKEGKIAAEIAVTGANTSANITVHFNNTVKMVLSNVTSGKATIRLSSSDHVGTNVLIFVSNSVISSNSNVKVTFDGVTVQLNSVSGVLNTTSSTSATFAEMQTTGGILILVHVPHFSNHTIVVSSSGSTNTSPLSLFGTSGGKLIVVVGLIVVISGITAAVVVRKRKN